MFTPRPHLNRQRPHPPRGRHLACHQCKEGRGGKEGGGPSVTERKHCQALDALDCQ